MRTAGLGRRALISPPQEGGGPRAGTAARAGDAHAQPGLQAAVLLRHPEAAPVLQCDEGLIREARAELPEKATLEVGQHAVHVHQHPQGSAAHRASRPARPPAPRRRDPSDAGPRRTPAAQPDHGLLHSLVADSDVWAAPPGAVGQRDMTSRRNHCRLERASSKRADSSPRARPWRAQHPAAW